MKIIGKSKLWILSIALLLSGCSYLFRAKFYLPGFEDMGYERFSDYDIRELEEQIPGYWSYYEAGTEEKNNFSEKLTAWETEWITAGTYKVGEDIESGLYIVWLKDEEEEILVRRPWREHEGEWEEAYDSLWYNQAFYLQLDDENTVVVPKHAQIALAEESAPSLSGRQEQVYYDGSYKVGEELPEGEYFVIEFDMTTLRDEYGDRISFNRNRFQYVVIDDIAALNLKGCALFPLDAKPEVHPVKYQGTGAGEGKYVYPNGMYKIGEDLPVGTYQIKNELFHAVSDLSYEGYHGNAEEYYAEVNWCGLETRDGDDPQSEEYRKKLGWWGIELDNRVDELIRTIKIMRMTEDGMEEDYKHFVGLPTITFTEDEIGCCFGVQNCILIPCDDE